MPYCPKCREEFREGVKTCPDCGVELVAELPRPEEEEGPAEQAVFVATSGPHVAERVERACRTAGIPCMQVGDEEGLSTFQALLSDAPIEREPPSPFRLQRPQGCLQHQLIGRPVQ